MFSGFVFINNYIYFELTAGKSEFLSKLRKCPTIRITVKCNAL